MLESFKEVLDIFLERDEGKIRFGYALLWDKNKDAEDSTLENFSGITNVDKPFQASIKLISDGSNQGLTGFQNEKYCCEVQGDDKCGIFNFTNPPKETEGSSKPDFTKLAKAANNKGWPLMIHANGDRAIDLTLDVYEKVIKTPSTKEGLIKKRHRIEHCSLLNEKRIDKMKELGISPSFLIGHVGYWGYSFYKTIFKEKAFNQLDLCKSSIDKGIKISLHSDYAVSPLGPLRLMEQAVTRIMEYKNHEKENTDCPKDKIEDEIDVLNENEKISREEALRAITTDAAWQCNCDNLVGDLDKGKKADYIILENDPITIKNVRVIRDIKVLHRWIGGKEVDPYKLKDAIC